MKTPVIYLSKVFLLEILRDKWAYGALAVAVALFGLSMAVGSLSFDEQVRILFHLSLSTIQLVGFGICLILGISTMSKEVEKQTCLLMLARPVSRGQFLLAKGLALSFFLGVFNLTLGLFLGLLLRENVSWPNLFSILFMTWLEHLIVLWLALCAGLFLGRAIAGLFTVGIFLLGHWLPDLAFFARKSQSAVFEAFNEIAQLLIPHLYELNIRSVYYLKSGLTGQRLLWACLHSFGWVFALFLIGSLIWRKKDLV